ncbi:hypothetical protein CLM83_10120, partial [Streptomyces albidoflavus]
MAGFRRRCDRAGARRARAGAGPGPLYTSDAADGEACLGRGGRRRARVATEEGSRGTAQHAYRRDGC